MCGIVGFWDQSGLIKNISSQVLSKMSKSIMHRGPDDSGYYEDGNGISFAHRRLSIIDLSNNGHQPLISQDNKYVLVFNGEIYNFKEISSALKAKGIIFRTNTDTEVILNAYKYYGTECLKYFNGMFAFVIWDQNKQIIFAARDRIGIKPFYYYFDGKNFVFSSEIKSLFYHPRIKKEPNYNAVINYNVLSHQLNSETWFKNIFNLDPGSYLIVKKDSIFSKKYWEPYSNVDYKRSYNQTVGELSELIKASIQLHQTSDVAVGAHLSGGVDSSAIVALSSHENIQLHTFSSSFSGFGARYDESLEINTIVERFNTRHHQVSSNGNDVKNMLPLILKAMDEPVAGPAILPMFFVNKLIHETGIKVVNGGQGVDELFGGYPPFFILAFKNLVELAKMRSSFPFSELAYIPSYFNKYFKGRSVFSKSSQASLNIWNQQKNQQDCIEVYREIANSFQPGLLSFEKIMLMSLRFYLPALLHQEDRMSMAWSIESRVPFLDYRLVEYALTIPSYFKIRRGVSKAVFRDALRGSVPSNVLYNKIKRGYPTPICEWSRNELASYFINILGAKNLHIDTIFNKKSIAYMLKEHMSGQKDFSSNLWSLLLTEVWFKENFG